MHYRLQRCTFSMVSILLSLSALILLPATLPAGELDSPGAPSTGSKMPTTTDIYNRLLNGSNFTVPSAFQGPSTGPTAGTGHTLNEISAMLPAADNTNGAAVSEVLQGKTFWGLRTDGTWGLSTGSAVSPVLGDNVSGANGALVIPIPDGLYTGGKTATANDSNLAAQNIKQGVTLFNVPGMLPFWDCSDTGNGGAASFSVCYSVCTMSSAPGAPAVKAAICEPPCRFLQVRFCN